MLAHSSLTMLNQRERVHKKLMFKKILVMTLLVMVAILCVGCGGDKKIAEDGKSIIIDLPEGEKLVNFAGDNYNTYVVHRKRRADEKPEDYTVDRISQDGWDGYEQTSGCYVIHEH